MQELPQRLFQIWYYSTITTNILLIAILIGLIIIIKQLEEGKGD